MHERVMGEGTARGEASGGAGEDVAMMEKKIVKRKIKTIQTERENKTERGGREREMGSEINEVRGGGGRGGRGVAINHNRPERAN